MEREFAPLRIGAQTVERFRKALRDKEYSPGTVECYARSIRALAHWSGGAVDRASVLAWKAMLAERYAPATVNAMLAGTNAFFAFLGREDCRVRPLRIQRRSFLDPARELGEPDYRTLVRTARSIGQERLALVMETMAATGIRVSETAYITVEAARQGKAEIALKGKIRTILLPGQLCRRLLRYAKGCGITGGAVFRTRTGCPMSRVQIWAEMKRLCARAGVEPSRVFPHNLRHLFARTFYRACRDVVKLADVLGHSSVDTTRIYLLTAGTEHVRQLERLRLLC